MMRRSIAVMLIVCCSGCNEWSGKKEKQFTRQDGANLAKEVADAKTLAMQAQASVATDEFKNLGTQIYIGEGENAMMLTVPKDKNGKHQRLSDMRFMILREAERLRAEPSQECAPGNNAASGFVPPPTN